MEATAADKIYDCIVIGGGPAGMMAALVMARRGFRVLLTERNELLGRKLRITGKGRCNLTNDCDFDTVIRHICQGGKFLYSSLHRFSNRDLIRFFEENGLETVTERGGRVFPKSQKAYDVAELLSALLRAEKVPVLYRAYAEELLYTQDPGTEKTEPKRVCGVLFTVNGKREKRQARAVLVACGGFTYPGTGSDGSGYRLARAAGHTIIPPRPSLVAVLCREKAFCRALQGLTLKNVAIRLERAGKGLYDDFGELLFTENGVSGPTVLSASRHIDPQEAQRPDSGYALHIDLKPALTPDKLDERILRDFHQYERKQFMHALHDLLPQRMIREIVARSGIAPDLQVANVSREDRRKLVALLKDLTLTPCGTEGREHAIVTAGGVDVREVNPKTMASRLCRGLYFAGEVLDVDAYTGGYNLTIAFSTGYAAGEGVTA